MVFTRGVLNVLGCIASACTYLRDDNCRAYNNSINAYTYKIVFMDKPNTNYPAAITICLLCRCAAMNS